MYPNKRHIETNCKVDQILSSLATTFIKSSVFNLRWLKTVSGTFQDVDFDGNYNHSISVHTKIMGSKNCPIIGEHVAVKFVTQQVTIAAM